MSDYQQLEKFKKFLMDKMSDILSLSTKEAVSVETEFNLFGEMEYKITLNQERLIKYIKEETKKLKTSESLKIRDIDIQ